MRPAIIICDDFYDDPDSIRTMALALDFQYPAEVNYTGRTAQTPQDIRPVVERLSDLLGGIGLRCRRDDGSFRVSTCDDALRQTSLVHVDSLDYSAVIYLSPDNREGTYFYRHRGLGLSRVAPRDNEDPKVRAAIENDTLDPEAWEQTDSIGARYNRLVLFDSKCFHSGARTFTGHAIAEGRLTQHFFLSLAP